MALTERQIKAREGKLTASRVACLMTGDDRLIYDLWLEMTGDPSFVPPDFSSNWHVRLGETTEQLNLEWFEKMYGPVSARGKVVTHPDYPWAAATLDGWSDNDECPIECKHLVGFEKTDQAVIKYAPQLHWQMIVTNSDQCVFSVIQGGRPPDVRWIKYDKDFADELLKRAETFIGHVRNLTEPVTPPKKELLLPAEKVYDYTSDKKFKELEGAYVQYVPQSRAFAKVQKLLKEYIPKDAKTVYGLQLTINRSATGRITIKESGNDEDEDD